MTRILRWGLTVTLAGCATASPKPPQEATETSIESARAESSSQTSDETQTAQPAQAPAGPVKLIIATEIGRTPVAAHVKVHGEDGSVLVEGNSGEVLTVQPGEFEVEATVTDPQALIDLPTKRERITVEAGAESKQRVEFARCRVRVTVNIRGKLDPKAVVTLSRNGKEVAKLTSGAEEYVSISPGRYAASVKSDRAAIAVSEIALNEDATQTIPINMN